MTRTTGLALGAVGAALLGTDPRLADVASLLAIALAVAATLLRLAGRRPAARTAAAATIGIAFVLGRVALGGPAPSPPGSDALPAGDGPWTVRVETIAAPKDGTQRFVGGLEDGAGLRVDVSAPRYPPVRAGDRVEVRGALRAPPEGPYGAYLARTGVVATLITRSVRALDAPADADRVVQGIRAGAGDALARALPEPAAGLAAGILIGLRERVDRDLAADFTTTGLSHVVAISGWNIALVAGLVAALLQTWARRRRALATVGAIALYTILAGASASVLRASVMAGVALLARETGRPGTAARALAWAVVILLVVNPGTVTDAGFQLSAAATAGLLTWGTPLAARFRAKMPWLPGFVVEGLAVSLAAQAATLPIVLLSFGRLAPLSPLLNLVVVPLVPLAMATGTLAMVGGIAAGAGAPAILATLLGLPGAVVIGLLVMIVQKAADLPFAGVTLAPPVGAALGGLAAASLVVVAARRRISQALRPRRATAPHTPPGRPGAADQRARPGPRGAGSLRSDRGIRLLATALALVVALATVAAAARPDGRLHVVALDVGQGDAILVETPAGGRLLVDGGPDPDRLLVALDERIPPWDRRIDLVVVTHPHEDHVGGLALLVERYRVAQVREPGMAGPGPAYAALEAALASRHQSSGRLAAGDRFALDDVRFEVLWPDRSAVPPEPPDTGSGINSVSIVLLGSFGAQRFLLTGDAEEGIDPILVARGLPSVDLLKVAHHGSRTATSDALLGAARPAVALVSVGAKNTFGHPAPGTLARLSAHGVTTYRTDLQGSLDVALDGHTLDVRTERAWAPAPTPGATAVRAPAGAAAAVREPLQGDPRLPGMPKSTLAVPYDRADVHSRAARSRRHPPRARATGVASPPRPGRRGGRRLARLARRRHRERRGPGARRSGGVPPRRRQGALRT